MTRAGGEIATMPPIRGTPMARRLNKQEKEWQADEDARMLAEVELIKTLPTRLGAAKKAARRMADEELERAKKMRTVANTRERKQPEEKGSQDKGPPPKKRNRKVATPNTKYNVFKKL